MAKRKGAKGTGDVQMVESGASQQKNKSQKSSGSDSDSDEVRSVGHDDVSVI